MQQYIWYLLIILAVPTVLSLVGRGAVKKIAGTASLVIASLVVLLFVGNIMSGSGRVMKNSPGLGADKAELQLRLTYAIQVGMTELIDRMKVPAAEKAKMLDKGPGDQTQVFEMSEESLAEAIARGDNSPVLKAKIAVLLKDKEIYLAKQKALYGSAALKTASRKKPKAELPLALRNPLEIGKELEKNSDPKIAQLGRALVLIFSSQGIPKSEVTNLTQAIEAGLPFGWYRDNLLRLLYVRSGGNQQLESLIADRNGVYLRTFLGAVLIVITALISTVIGCLVILIELAMMSRKGEPKPDAVGLDVDMLTLYKVFIAWFATQAAISMTLQYVVKGGLKLNPDPMTMGIVTAITYLIANVPGLVYIWWFALRPRGLKFWEAMKFRMRTPTAGPVKLIFAGYLGWCAAFPLVMITAVIAGHYMNSQGSENPVISQIMSAANAPDPLPILIFYLTIAVMAPICEETMFRGFIYATLRKNMGMPLAVLCSAMIFGLVHFDKGGILGLIAIGVVLAYVFERTRSLLACMVTHGLWNGAMFTATLILFGTR